MCGIAPVGIVTVPFLLRGDEPCGFLEDLRSAGRCCEIEVFTVSSLEKFWRPNVRKQVSQIRAIRLWNACGENDRAVIKPRVIRSTQSKKYFLKGLLA